MLAGRQALPISSEGDAQPDCFTSPDTYDLGLHIAAVFVLLAASAFGVFFPVCLGQKKVQSRSIDLIFFVLRHFGSGIIISTAFIHLLFEAYETFSDECIGHLAFEPAPAAISMGSLFLVFLIDFVAARAMWLYRSTETQADPTERDAQLPDLEDGSHHNSIGKMDEPRKSSPESSIYSLTESSHYHKRARWDVQLLESGIVFHSVLIGVALGAQGGTTFVPTFCALVFHQMFEGLGLGARIGRLCYNNETQWQKWFMCAIYAIITPVGISIGIGVRSTVNFNARSTLLVVGVFDSMSAGILLYGSIAQILVGDWLSESPVSLKKASHARVVLGLACLVAGMISMSALAEWI